MTDLSWAFGLAEGSVTISAPPRVLAQLGPDDPVIEGDEARPDGDGWRLEAKDEGFFARLFRKGRTVRMFEVEDARCERCFVLYRAKLKTEELHGRAYLEMWCRFRVSRFFSRGLMRPVSGTTDWTACETPFFLREGERPERYELNVVIEGEGKVWVKQVELLALELTEEELERATTAAYGQQPESGQE